jgi:hypothetical protein
MHWGTVEEEPEVHAWLEALGDRDFGHAAFHIDRLADEGVHSTEPQSRDLDGKLRELRFSLGGQRIRISYWIAPGRRIVLLTVFHKSARRERREIERAKRALAKCQKDQHTADEEES